MRQYSADQWQYRRIGHLEQEETSGKGEERAVLPQHRASRSRWSSGLMVVGSADRASKMNVGGADPAESDERRNYKKRRREKYEPVRHEISERAHESSGHQAPSGLEALIAPKSLGQRGLADEAQAHGRDRGPDQSARGSLQRQGD
jgi:hypothetical protein